MSEPTRAFAPPNARLPAIAALTSSYTKVREQCSDFADQVLQPVRRLQAPPAIFPAGGQSPQSDGVCPHCSARDEPRSRIALEPCRSLGPSNKCTGQARSDLPQDSVAAEA